MNNATIAVAQTTQAKAPALQTKAKAQLNTGYYDLLAQIALTHKRTRNSRQA
ncbi:hypothetical protein [Bacterioplanoides sp.]|uniref:hypothetical protein n=1 Tax=Bacterioplanoides sp. TaxID=2066072 RepID=UPI003B002FBC